MTSVNGNPHWFIIIYRFMKKRVFYLKNFESYENRKFTSNVLQKSKSAYNVSLLLLKIEHSFFQESIDNNKSIGVTIYRCQIQAIIKKRKTFEVFKLIYLKKPPIKKVLIKPRILWFNELCFNEMLVLKTSSTKSVDRVKPWHAVGSRKFLWWRITTCR